MRFNERKFMKYFMGIGYLLALFLIIYGAIIDYKLTLIGFGIGYIFIIGSNNTDIIYITQDMKIMNKRLDMLEKKLN